MELHDHPVSGQKNKFVVTQDEAYFVPCTPDNAVPSFADILAEVFDLNDPEVVKALEEDDNGKLILGYWEEDGGLDIHVPSERSEDVNRRLQEILGG